MAAQVQFRRQATQTRNIRESKICNKIREIFLPQKFLRIRYYLHQHTVDGFVTVTAIDWEDATSTYLS
jgi:hypothetical protein